jgi:hypothetical protein
MPDRPSDYNENQLYVDMAIDIIEDVLIPTMREVFGKIAPAYGYTFDFDSAALGMFRRRYRMSLTKALADQPDQPVSYHLALLKPVMEAQARIAAAIALFKAIKSGHPPAAGSQVVVDKDSLQQATHVLENECRDIMTKMASQRTENDDASMVAIYCS